MRLSERLKPKLKSILYYGDRRHCSVCDRSVRSFLAFGDPPRSDALCPLCGSVERDRLTLWYLQNRTTALSGGDFRMLHVAPEEALSPIFAKAAGEGYLTADLEAPHVMQNLDITKIPYPDGTFDAIYCSHVLEHVIDDALAMRELQRVLNPKGWAVLNVPVTVEETFEDAGVVDPAERLRLFGQDNHVRRYGADYGDRLKLAGFQVSKVSPEALLDADQIVRFGLENGASGDLYYCTKSG